MLILESQGLELNDTAEAVWRLCSGDASIQAIVDSIAEEYDADPEQIAEDVVDLVQELEAVNALVLEPKS
ncbi:PqqD family protein [Luedemannella helvata]|uniref:PqqD family protein n=1 Tax=Luedemannella helvata TaxID=349315 RepID=UPI0031CF5237